MNKFANLHFNDREDIITEISLDTGLHSAIIEKSLLDLQYFNVFISSFIINE